MQFQLSIMVGKGTFGIPHNLELCSFRKVNFKSLQKLSQRIAGWWYQLSRLTGVVKHSLKIFANLSHGFWCCILTYENSFFSLFSVSILGSGQYWEPIWAGLQNYYQTLKRKKKALKSYISLEHSSEVLFIRMQISLFKKEYFIQFCAMTYWHFRNPGAPAKSWGI